MMKEQWGKHLLTYTRTSEKTLPPVVKVLKGLSKVGRGQCKISVDLTALELLKPPSCLPSCAG